MLNRYVVQFAIIITNRQLLRRLVARFMAILVFSWKDSEFSWKDSEKENIDFCQDSADFGEGSNDFGQDVPDFHNLSL